MNGKRKAIAHIDLHIHSALAPLFLDRIDLHIDVQPEDFDQMSSTADGEPSEAIRERVVAARAIQNMRFAAYPDVHCNAQMTPAMIRQFASPDQAGLAKLKDAMTRLNMSARAYDRILKVARTIADLDGSDNVLARHIQEAISYRNLDRTDWAER